MSTKTFKDLGLSHDLLRVIEEVGFTEPTEIQEKTIPLALAGKDIIGGSATGSGKTLAFGAAILEKIQRKKGIQALILTPTRELTEQVSKSLAVFSKYKTIKIAAIYGGVSIGPQIEDLKRADIVVGTPGRILDHIERRTLDLSKVEFLVLDEADRMLDMGFIHDVTVIVEHCPKKRQSFMFSATVSGEIIGLSQRYMHHPVEVSVESYVDPSKLEQVFYEVPSHEKFSLLVHLLKEEHSKLVMVFCNTKRNADFIGKNLRRYGFDALALHGNLSQNQRNHVLEQFHKSDKFILVCTDVAARGLDIKNVSHVYNYDSPKTSIEYIHRVGRTARAGKEGKAITLLSQRDFENFRRVLQDDSLKIKKLALPQFEKVFIKIAEGRFSNERRGSFRPNRFRSREGFRHTRPSYHKKEEGRSHGRFGSSQGRRFGRRDGTHIRHSPHSHQR